MSNRQAPLWRLSQSVSRRAAPWASISVVFLCCVGISGAAEPKSSYSVVSHFSKLTAAVPYKSNAAFTLYDGFGEQVKSMNTWKDLVPEEAPANPIKAGSRATLTIIDPDGVTSRTYSNIVFFLIGTAGMAGATETDLDGNDPRTRRNVFVPGAPATPATPGAPAAPPPPPYCYYNSGGQYICLP